MKRLIIVGSPRSAGRSAHLAEMLFEANIDEHPEDELFLVPVSEVEIGPCIACDACREKSGVILKDESGKEVTVQRNRCVFDDDMQTLYDLIDDVDEVTIVSPVYFSGAPAQLKCLYDRLQPYYWDRDRNGRKKPATLHVIGEGGDPHGYDALVSETRSALAVAGFRLERVLDWVGKIDEQGEITAEAKQVVFDEEGKAERPKLSLSSSPGDSLQGVRQGKQAKDARRQDERRKDAKRGTGPKARRDASHGAKKQSSQQHGSRRQNAQQRDARKRDAQQKGPQKKGGRRG